MADGSDFQNNLGTTGDQGGLRDALQKRLAYYLAPAEDPTAFIAVDPVTASVTPILLWGRGIFWYDSTDTTSIHDGVTVLVSSDGRRYKLASTLNRISALDLLTAPPGSPAIGATYLVGAAATGAFSGHDNDIAHYTPQGWAFEDPIIGMLLHVEDVDAYYHYSSAGAWVAGFGDTALAANSVIPASVLGGFNRWVIENQTTNAPPGSPTDGVAYIIGGAPSGAWVGRTKDLAIAKGGTWIIVDPGDGFEAYDKSTGVNYIWSAALSLWVGKGGAYLAITEARERQQSVLQIVNSAVSVGYVFSDVTPPSTSDPYLPEILTLPIQADFATQVFDFEYHFHTYSGIGGTPDFLTVGVFIDAEANARAWRQFAYAIGIDIRAHMSLSIGDTSAHTVKFFVVPHGAGGMTGVLPVSNRILRAIKRADASVIPILIPQATGTRIGTFTAQGGLVAAFDGTTSQAVAAGSSDAASPGYVGKDYHLAPFRIERALFWGANNGGYTDTGSASTTITLRGKNGSAPSSDSDGTSLGSITFADRNDSFPLLIISNDQTTAWDYVFLQVVSAGNVLYVAEVQFYTPP